MPAADTALPARGAEDREPLPRLRQALRRLPPAEQEVFFLHQNGGLTYERIAETCHRPVAEVKMQMRGALRQLRQALA
jgi:RNA polymerase sigma factor (sigma-70 family)